MGSVRPESVTVLVVLSLMLGVMSLFGGLLVTGLGLFAFDNSEIPPSLVILGPVVILFGILEILIGIGFLEETSAVWSFGIIVAVLNLVFSIGVYGIGLVFRSFGKYSIAWIDLLSLVGIVPVAVSVVTLVVLTRQQAKPFLGKGG